MFEDLVTDDQAAYDAAKDEYDTAAAAKSA
jgi:hypothetical protein